jgi:tetratricopeptide (TPR) repeat protein
MLGFGGFTSVFVLVVLPKRFILQAGLVESGITFETEILPFQPPERQPDIQPTSQMAATVEPGVGVGPAELFWAEVLPLLTAGDYQAALPVFNDYLSDYPGDLDVLREYAVALVRGGRPEEAEVVYRTLIEAGEVGYRLELARLLRDRGDLNQAIALFNAVVRENPENSDVRLELARALLWGEKYDEAVALYRELAHQDPRSLPVRLELAQALYWKGQPEEAFGLLSGYPSHDSGWPVVDSLLIEIVPQIAPRALTFPELIQRAIDAGHVTLASELYTRMLLRSSVDSDRWEQWVDFLQYQLEDLEAARSALMSRDSSVGLSPDSRYRLAQLHVWTNREEMGKAELQYLLSMDPQRAEAWVLLGNLHRWDGDRLRAWDAYSRALELSPGNADALAGMGEIRTQVDLAISERDETGVSPRVAFFRDSDDYRRLDMGLEAAKRWYSTVLVLRTGYRYLDGPEAIAASGSQNGPFVELEVVRWWRLGTVRTSVTAGVQELEALGSEPTFNARIEIPNAAGTALQASFAHGPAYPHTATLGSVLGGVRSDDIQVSAYRSLGKRWSVAGAATLVSLRGGGVDNWRMSGSVTAASQISGLFRAGLTSRVLTHTDAAPMLNARRLYWDPSAFWTNSLLIELRTPEGERWFVFGRLTPGFALARERETSGTQWVPQFATEAGAGHDVGRFTVEADVGYYRGRAGDYNSLAANLRLSIRP